MNVQIPKCKRFTGYKPCFPGHNCIQEGCKDFIPIGVKILLINLDAMGDILMTTAQLNGIKRKFPESTIYWVTLKSTVPLLFNNPYIDKVMPYDFETISVLSQLEFDYVMNVDKSLRSGALAQSVKAKHRLGFGLNGDGKIIPLNQSAEYNYKLGMDDHLKFRVNRKTGQEYLAETFELDYKMDDYVFNFYDEELKFIRDYKDIVGIRQSDKVIGFNTGCSLLYPNKKMTVEQHTTLIERFLSLGEYKIVLLGGPEDEARNEEISSRFSGEVINTPVKMGVRRGACFESLADVIITGDSFGMHLAIALKKYVIAWFGLSCWTEIELYGRGIKLFPEGLECAPCWKKDCPYDLECRSMVDLERIVKETLNYFENIKSKEPASGR
ncbi:MAG: glycosyltransferase family 9 protein [Ignavibacteria bacterium]|jgi:heptosyltransferase-2|nr:glycosyltransferase family 9 protein [Ignavibacteria bacterium]MCU7504034.1 glycosyltransferase family 9 protein [Ignavibacteria bacterium]MCU7515406.1 glycosyltransferase family 9 protein [Ignavibacteria bacterium]